MNWRNFFIAGLLLSLSPFYLKSESYFFHYSLLGFGLIGISYVYKKAVSKVDVVLITCLVFLVLSGLLNLFLLFNFFEYLFLLLFFINVLRLTDNDIVRWISFPVIGIMGVLFSFFAGSFFGLKGLADIAVFLFYFAYFMTGSVIVLDYKQLEKK